MESKEWEIQVFDSQGHRIVKHWCIKNNSSIAWPFPDHGEFKKHHCMTCGEKLPNHLMIQLDLLNSGLK